MAVIEATPHFSWRLAAATAILHAVRQTGYQLRVARLDSELGAGRGVLWDTGRIRGAETTSARYAGPALEPSHPYVWQVRVWDEDGHPSQWSRPAHWTQAPIWTAQWIAANATDQEATKEPLPLLRKNFRIPGKVIRAVIYAAGLGQDELRLNGLKVGNSELTPGWSDYRKTVFYDSYDVTALLRSGSNTMGVLLGNGMFRVLPTPDRYTKFTGSYGQPTCIMQLHIELAGGRSLEIASDESWKTQSGPITFSSTYGGEDYDARLELSGWDSPTYDDSGWRYARVVPGPGGILRPELAPPIRIMRTYLPIHRTEPKPGVLVFDLGQNFAGWPAITVIGPAGAVVKLIPGELLEKDGTVSQKSSGEPQWFSYTLRGKGHERWHPRFSYYGFRYVQVEGAVAGTVPVAGKVTLVGLRGKAVHTSSELVGSFASSDTSLNKIHTMIVRSIESNAVSLFTDCPHREKLGWLEETHLLAPSMLYDFDFAGLYAATARNIADVQKADGPKAGMVPEIAPQFVVFDPEDGPFNDSPEWGSAAVLAPWYVYERGGDLQFLAGQLDVMRRYVDYLGTRAQDGIIDYGLGDWYDIGPGDPGYSKLTTAGVTATAIYYQDLLVLQKTTALTDATKESHGYAEKAEAIRQAFNRHFFDTAHHRYDKGSQTAQAMPLVLGIVPENERRHVLDALVSDVRAHENHVTAGDIGYHYVVEALLDGGRSDVLLDMLQRTDSPSYGYQLTQGATALTEAWDANPASSQDHFMLGDAEEWFYRGLGGIQVDLSAQSPRQLVLHPEVVGNLTWVRSQYRSALGAVASSWRRGVAQTTYNFTIPANTTATVEVRTARVDSLRIDGLPLTKNRGASFSSVSGNIVAIVLGSGNYRVVAANPTTEPLAREP